MSKQQSYVFLVKSKYLGLERQRLFTVAGQILKIYQSNHSESACKTYNIKKTYILFKTQNKNKGFLYFDNNKRHYQIKEKEDSFLKFALNLWIIQKSMKHLQQIKSVIQEEPQIDQTVSIITQKQIQRQCSLEQNQINNCSTNHHSFNLNFQKILFKVKPFNTHFIKIPKFNQSNQHYLQKHWQLTENKDFQLLNKSLFQILQQFINKQVINFGKNQQNSQFFYSNKIPIFFHKNQSLLQKLAKCFGTAPIHLQNVSGKKNNAIQRIKRFLTFTINFSVLFLTAEKTFDPLLGETFQGFINGCPIYCEQISTDPPKTSIIFFGRGYTIFGSLQLKVLIGFNNIKGIFLGELNVQFQDSPDNQQRKQKYRITASIIKGKLNGLMQGKNIFNIYGSGYIYDNINNFGSYVNSEKNLIQGYIGKVNDDEWNKIKKMDRFENYVFADKNNFLIKNDKIEIMYGENVRFNRVEYHNYQDFQYLPFELQKEQICLPSDSIFRQDILLSKLDLQKSQVVRKQLYKKQQNDKQLRKI